MKASNNGHRINYTINQEIDSTNNQNNYKNIQKKQQ